MRNSLRELLDKFDALKQAKKRFIKGDSSEEEEKIEKGMQVFMIFSFYR